MRTEIAEQSRRKERKMKASEMTNEMLLADELEKPLVGSRIVIEAAARLRKFDITIVAQKAKAAAEGYAHGCEEVADLRRLKVAADALEKLQDRLVSSVHDGTIDPHEALKIAEDAIAAIREEGGAK